MGVSKVVKAFRSPKKTFGSLDPEIAAALVATAADMALVCDEAGMIYDVSIQSDALASELAEHVHWPGRKWHDLVTVESRPKIDALLADAATSGQTISPRWRHINYRTANGPDVPILAATVRIGRDGRIVAFSRDLRDMAALQQRLVAAQQSLEQDYARRIQMETRYRLLFQMSPDPVVILDVATLKIVEANPAARDLLGDHLRRVVGRTLSFYVAEEDAQAVQTLLGGVRGAGRGEERRVRLAESGQEIVLAAHFFRQDDAQLFLVRLTPLAEGMAAMPGSLAAKLLHIVEKSPDAFVVTDMDGRVIAANAAFLDLVQLPAVEEAHGESLERWLGRPGVDLGVLIANLRQHGSVRLFATSLRGESGITNEVEISAVAVANQEQMYFGFTIRNVGYRLPAGPNLVPAANRALPRSVEQLTELIGRVALKDLVREATDMIERLCIEAALEMTGDNRASAAEILGLSRQSLYVKLRRYGLGELSPEDGES
jgi:transcriptional regulator PpsR